MIKCTYIIHIHNDERTISKVIDSLKKIKGDFIKEYIIIDYNSTDNSLKILNSAFLKTIILTSSKLTRGEIFNQALEIVNGHYIHFVEGNSVLKPDSTLKLINACHSLKTQVAIGLDEINLSKSHFPKTILLNSVISDILENKQGSIRNIGVSGSLVTKNILKKIGEADNEIYNLNMLLSLKCADFSNFALVNEYVCQTLNLKVKNHRFEVYNNLLAILNFFKKNNHLSKHYNKSLLLALYNELSMLGHPTNKLYNLRYMIYKYLNILPCEQILKLYEKELKKLF